MSERVTEPDDFELSSTDGQVSIRFSDFGFVRPQLNYHEQRDPEQRFIGPQDIERSSASGLGDVITVTLDNNPDGDRVDLTLLLPAVRLRGDNDSVETIAIRTTTRGSIAPQTLEGQLQAYDVIHLLGKARSVGDATVENGNEFPQTLFQTWFHAREEDTDEVEVYRPGSFSLPPSRWREHFKIEAGGGFVRYDFGPGDELVEHPGRWEITGEKVIKVTLESGTSYSLSIESVETNMLRLRR